MKYCLDTSALVEPWQRHYPHDLFEPVWEALGDLIVAGHVRAPVEVRRELERQSDGLLKWANGWEGLFEDVDEAQLKASKEIVNKYPSLVKPNSTKSQADPFVIALAEVRGVAVITYETRAKKNEAPKIPNVCEDRKIKMVTFVELLRAEGFKA